MDGYSGACYKAFNNKTDANTFLIMKLRNMTDDDIDSEN